MLRLALGEKYKEPCALLLGGFDGLHRGHMSLLREAKKSGFPVGMTVLLGAKEGGELFTLSEREEIFAEEGVSFLVELFFTEELRSLPAEEFLKKLFRSVPVRAVYCGQDFRFGNKAQGDVALLKAFAPCPVTALPALEEDGKKISVSEVKALLSKGEVERANRLLFHPYFISGEVERGRQVGRKVGFPTVNLSFSAEKPLSEGVYCGYTQTVEGRYPSIINVGGRPTFGVEEKKIEAHLLGFSGDLYGSKIKIYPVRFLRPIFRFENAEELKRQLQKDISELNHVL